MTYLCNVQEGEAEAVGAMEDLGLRVETVPWKEAPRGSLRFYAELLANLFSRLPYNAAKDRDARLFERARKLLAAEPFDLVICDFVQMAGNAIGLPGPKLLFQHNVEAEIFERHARQDSGWLRRLFMGYQAGKMRRFEGHAGRQFDRVIAVSERDRQQFARRYGWSHVQTIDTAVDVEFFRPSESAEEPARVSFVGSMDWLPNVDGVEYLVQDIWPRVRSARPQARLQIVGRNPAREVQRFDGQDGVEVTGAVPDVRPFYGSSAVVVVPLRIGGGTRIKIYEAMAMAKPVVSTTLGAEGLRFTPGQQIELADEPQTFADKIITLLDDAGLRKQIGGAARAHVCEHFSADVVARQFEKICLETTGHREVYSRPLATSGSTIEAG